MWVVHDPTSCFVDLNDKELPNLDTCLTRSGFDKPASCNSLDDAWDIAYLFSHINNIDWLKEICLKHKLKYDE